MNTANEKVIRELESLLASSYTLYLKTQNYHWNVTGPMFTTLHTLFETQYSELALAIDEVAERIRSLGSRAPGSYSEFSRLSRVDEDESKRTAIEMIENLVDDQQRIATSAKTLIGLAEKARDPATADLATRRLDVHEKNAWMLRSHVE